MDVAQTVITMLTVQDSHCIPGRDVWRISAPSLPVSISPFPRDDIENWACA